MDLKQLLTEKIKNSGLTLSAIEAGTGVFSSTLSDYVHGKRTSIKIETVQKLMDFFGLDVCQRTKGVPATQALIEAKTLPCKDQAVYSKGLPWAGQKQYQYPRVPAIPDTEAVPLRTARRKYVKKPRSTKKRYRAKDASVKLSAKVS